jgi:hypothetical protein
MYWKAASGDAHQNGPALSGSGEKRSYLVRNLKAIAAVTGLPARRGRLIIFGSLAEVAPHGKPGQLLARPSGCGLKGCCKVHGIPVGKIKTDKDTLSGGDLFQKQ